MAGEFAGTFLFLFFAFTGTQVANSQTQGGTSTTIAQGSNPAQLLYISLCFGFSLAVNAWVFFRISGGLFNPAVRLQRTPYKCWPILTIEGLFWNDGSRCRAMATGVSGYRLSIDRRHCRCSCRLSSLPRHAQRPHYPGRRDNPHAVRPPNLYLPL